MGLFTQLLHCGDSQQHKMCGGAHQRGYHLDHQHYITLHEGTTEPKLSPPAEQSKSPSTHPHYFLQGNIGIPAVSLSGTGTVVKQTTRPSSGQ